MWVIEAFKFACDEKAKARGLRQKAVNSPERRTKYGFLVYVVGIFVNRDMDGTKTSNVLSACVA